MTPRQLRTNLFIIFCVALFAGPILFLVIRTITRGDFGNMPTPTENDYTRWGGLIGGTLRLTALTVALAALAGMLMAFAIRQARGLWNRSLLLLFPIPMLLPPELIAIAWTHILGKRGIAMEMWSALSGERTLPFSMYGEVGSAFVLAQCWYPLVTFAVLAGLTPNWLGAMAASRTQVSAWRTFWKVGLPLLAPYLCGGMACVAWLSIGDFDVPSVLLRNAFPVEIFSALQVYPDTARALMLTVPLLLLCGFIMLVLAWVWRRYLIAEADFDQSPDKGSTNASRAVTIAAAGWLFLAVALPVASLVHQAGSWSMVSDALQTGKPQIAQTFITATQAACFMLALALPYAWLLSRASGARRFALMLLALTPLAIPGTIHGMAWVQMLDASAAGRWFLQHSTAVALAHACRFFPFAVFVLAAALKSISPDVLEAAALSGASRARVGMRVVAPLIGPAMLAALTLGYGFSASDLSTAILLNPVGQSTLPVRLSSLLHFGKDDLLAALCLIQILVSLGPYLFVSILFEKLFPAH